MKNGRPEIDVQDRIPALLRDFQCGHRPVDARVVHQNIQPAKFGGGRIDGGGEFRRAEETSTTRDTARRPAPRTSSAAASSCSSLRPQPATSAPRSASDRAMARPSPPLAPVTRAFFPRNPSCPFMPFSLPNPPEQAHPSVEMKMFRRSGCGILSLSAQAFSVPLFFISKNKQLYNILQKRT